MKAIDKSSLEKILEALKSDGYTLIGPRLREGSVIYDEIQGISDLPAGWTDEQKAGYYRTIKRNDEALFGYVVGPHSWKKYLYPPKLKLWEAKKNGKSFAVKHNDGDTPRYAFIGMRSCEISAMLIHDRVFNNGMFSDSYYNRVRENMFVLGVNCTQAGGTCFCVSMNTGPKARNGYDIAITEITSGGHYFLLEEATVKGKKIAAAAGGTAATVEQKKAAEDAIKNAADHMGRHLKTEGIKEMLYKNYDSPVWEETAGKCLSCANCTLVCPTCFCSNVEDVTDLTGSHAERWRKWDSCFNLEYSKVAGGNFRTTSKARYRQWLTHKFASWIDQFGTSGCTGCGRCITWCPVGIDVTETVQKIKEMQRGAAKPVKIAG